MRFMEFTGLRAQGAGMTEAPSLANPLRPDSPSFPTNFRVSTRGFRV